MKIFFGALLMTLLFALALSFHLNIQCTKPSPISQFVRSLRMSEFDYDVIVVGCGVGGHAAALHARINGLKTAVLTGKDVGGTCVNRGCVPSKALLAAAGRVRELKDENNLKSFGITTQGVQFDRVAIAGHASTLANRVRTNLETSLKAQGVEVIDSIGQLTSQPHEIAAVDVQKIITGKNIILAPGSVPFIPPGIQVDEKSVLTSDGALKLDTIPQYVAIIGSGYIGLEFSDIYTALGSEVTFLEHSNTLMKGFDYDIRKLADRLLIKSRAIDYRLGVRVSEVTPGKIGKAPVSIKLIDANTKEYVDTLYVDACLVATGRVPNTKSLGLAIAGIRTSERGFVYVDETMRVLNEKDGRIMPGMYCIGDANGKMMLAHAASAQGISAVENIVGRNHIINHNNIPAACFTHPEVSFVGLTEDQAQEIAAREGFSLGKSIGHFRANSKALAECQADGICKLLYNKESGKIMGVHIIGNHAADLIQECSNAMVAGSTVKEIAMMTHTHPTLSEVVESTFKSAAVHSAH